MTSVWVIIATLYAASGTLMDIRFIANSENYKPLLFGDKYECLAVADAYKQFSHVGKNNYVINCHEIKLK